MFYVISCLAIGILTIAAVALYRVAYPTPLPDIPYLERSISTPFADLRGLLKVQRETGEVWKFLLERSKEIDSPIFQVFARPFEKPWVVVMDPMETHNILVRRIKELDRSEFFINFFTTFQPEFQMVMKTDDRWKRNRRLVAETQSPLFLNELVRQQIYKSVVKMLDFWDLKRRTADGRAFDAGDDVVRALLESSWAVHFGAELGATDKQINFLTSLGNKESTVRGDEHKVVFEKTQEPSDMRALKTFTQSYETKLKLPVLYELIFRLMFIVIPSLGAAKRRVDELIDQYLDAAYQKVKDPKTSNGVTCTTELLVSKAVQSAEKTGTHADYKSAPIRQEIMGSLIGAAESTGFTMCWAMKLLTENQHVQEKLRASLREAFSSDATLPSPDEIFHAHIPYLDATLEEILRCGNPMPVMPRTASVDTQILGYAIPKGTEVMMLVCGPGYQSKNRATTRENADGENHVPLWDDSNIHLFQPERWLKKSEDGKEYFDPRSGPMHAFGAGPRSCFGQRQARVQMRVFISLILSKFKLSPIPAELTDWMALDTSFRKPQRTYLRLEPIM